MIIGTGEQARAINRRNGFVACIQHRGDQERTHEALGRDPSRLPGTNRGSTESEFRQNQVKDNQLDSQSQSTDRVLIE